MRILLQRVTSASVDVEQQTIGAIEQGVLLLVGFTHEDEDMNLVRGVEKVLNLRIFTDERGRLHHSVQDIAGGVLLVPQFTLYANTDRGRRPDFIAAMKPELATTRFDELVALFRERASGKVATGQFGADMQVSLVNDGPVTLELEFND